MKQVLFYNTTDYGHLRQCATELYQQGRCRNHHRHVRTANLNVEQSQYVRMDNAKRINSSLFDRTNGVNPTTTPGHSQRLNGSANERYGIARSLSVMPGDVINAEVYAKYIDPNSSNWTTALSNLVSQINANAAGVVIDGTQYTTSTASFPASMLGHQTTNDNGAPRAYLNWLVFDRNYLFITGGFKQITTAAKEAGTDIAHELITMPAAITITQPGYVYIYLSNENSTPVEVFFDEFKATHTKSPVIQTDDYYPFGLTFNSHSREGSVTQKYKYNGMEDANDLALGWLIPSKFRTYHPELGRFMQVDPIIKEHESPYAWNTNNPLMYPDPEGADSLQRATAIKKAVEYVNKNPGNSYVWGGKGQPGQGVDCAGLVSASIVSAGELDPVIKRGSCGNGVTRLAQGSTYMDIQDAQEGNFVTLNNGKGPMSHTGLITKVKRDDCDVVVGFTIIDSGGDPDSGKSGPRYTEINFGGDKYWDNRVTGVYKWDSVPEKDEKPYFVRGKDPTMTDKMRETKIPLVRDLANIIDYVFK